MPRKVFIASHYFTFPVFSGLKNYWLSGQHLWGIFGHQLEICLKEHVQQSQRVFYINFTCDLRIANRNMLFLTCHFSKIFPQTYATYHTLSSFPSLKRKHSFFFPPHLPTLASFYHAQLHSELLLISISWVVKRSDSCKPPVWVFRKEGKSISALLASEAKWLAWHFCSKSLQLLGVPEQLEFKIRV